MSELDPLPTSPYEVLNVPKNATLATIRSAHRKLVLQCHPDRVTSEVDRNAIFEQFLSVQQAYEILSDGSRRQRLDEREKLAELREEMKKERGPFSGYTLPKKRPSDDLPRKIERKNPVQTGMNGSSYAGYSHESLKDVKEEKQTHTAGHTAPGGNSKRASLRYTFRGVQGLINGVNVDALADTGADQNFMNKQFAKEHKLRPRYFPADQRPSFLMGHGRTIQAVGQVEVSWKFRKELEKSYTLHFFVLPDGIFDVMIGGPFLYETETLAANKNRLIVMPKPRRALHVRTVNFCGSPSRRLKGLISGWGIPYNRQCAALPDSGAEPNLLNYEYVKRNGWQGQIVPGPQSCRLLMFADGSTARTEGQIALQWTFQKRWRPVDLQTRHAITFDVLDGCPVDVILGQDFLDEFDVFTTQSDAFIEPQSPAEASGLNLVIRAADGLSLKSLRNKLRKKTESKAKARRSSVEKGIDDHSDARLVDEELQRRAEFDQKLFRAKKSQVYTNDDQRREFERRSEWDKEIESEANFNDGTRSSPRRPYRKGKFQIAASEQQSPTTLRSNPSIITRDDTPRDSSARSTSTPSSDPKPTYLPN